ncbi:probable inactive receptor kinase At2g26730 [Diospyros lotus]|uniref:probable inactive receptor kinase At2g26730 n=1 Tax=Diospyros lotus TaxID=55363 RepID=UPI002250AD74|nr:probable inactive receptor kinase At2g26730 [Diospyros lotus]
MERSRVFVVSVILFSLLQTASSEKREVIEALVVFMGKLSPGNVSIDPGFGWNPDSDPCTDKWKGVSCDGQLQFVRKIVLEQLNLTGVLDATSLCQTKSLLVLSLNDNSVGGEIPEEISNCRYLTHLYLSGNRFSSSVPINVSQLSNLKRIDISNNALSGELPDISRISGLISFLAQNNQLSGHLPRFDFSNLLQFNVSNNNFSGPIPNVNGHFNASSFEGNPALCGPPLPNPCPAPPPAGKISKGPSKNRFLIYSGYGVLALALLLVIAIKLLRKKARKDNKSEAVKKGEEVDGSSSKTSGSTSSEFRNGGNRSEYSITSVESGKASSSLVVFSSPVVNGLKFEDLLQAPAELIGRGKHGSVYKVVLSSGVSLAVKRIRDWEISQEDLTRRLQRIDGAKHPNVLPALAYYCSRQEKLLVYEFLQNGSLFSLLYGSQDGRPFEWGSRLSIATRTAEALAFMHDELQEDGIAHGNLKSTNILFNKDMDPCISEYGLMVVENYQEQSFISQASSSGTSDSPDSSSHCRSFKLDVYAFGVVLLELLTGKVVQNNGSDLAKWVHSVVREEWTVEVFDRGLIAEGASEERMVSLLQVALKCINPAPDARPGMNQVAAVLNSIREEEERSIASDP